MMRILSFALAGGCAERQCLRLGSGGEIPAPAFDQPAAPGKLQTAVVAGGCFWGVQGVYQHLKGVKSVLSGYAGGDASTRGL